ncbi:AraC family transcriptional regulator [Ktedonosporobacter rubrisoli]|uniref:AraC family transcriptional regulator n=1 Tax=Ktedonosporobacter rubrisoli TaxID=2509675 RepID=A0A4P6JYK5_KTERU|nr:AraC family transcriptional regulator [Ktedonosporobacter rubrisoli]QBD80625.1 AraC family transcriptional regulator [Ktedonosporobacter rubrisoli]
MNYRAYIQASIDFIEDHLQEELTLEVLAKIAGFSPYHYSRVFHAYVGKPVMEYVTCRRLAYATLELVGQKRIIDIALDYGFATHHGFAKAFRKVYGCSPRMYSARGSGRLPPKLDLFLLTQCQYVKGALLMEAEIVARPAFKVAGYELKTTTRDNRSKQDIPTFWKSMTAEHFALLHNQLPTLNEAELGLCFPTAPAYGDFSYVIAVEVSDFNGVPAELFTAEIPEATYAVFSSPANDGEEQIASALQATWQYVYETWFPGSGYELATGKVDFEWYPCSNQGEKVKLFLPVSKR